jgi:hypothetical protein
MNTTRLRISLFRLLQVLLFLMLTCCHYVTPSRVCHFCYRPSFSGSWDSWVAVEPRLLSGKSVFRIWGGMRFFSLLSNIQTGCRAHTAFYWRGNVFFPPRVNRPERVVSYLLSSDAEVKNEWRYSSTPLSVFMAWEGGRFASFTEGPTYTYTYAL